MRSFIFLSSLLAFFASAVYGTALTYKLGANEKSCFFTFVEQKGAKVAFYFAVCRVNLYNYYRTNLLPLLGSIWWLVRCWLHCRRSEWESYIGRLEGAAGRLRFHSQRCWRVPILLQQWNVDIRGEDGRFWNRRRPPFTTSSIILGQLLNAKPSFCWPWKHVTRLRMSSVHSFPPNRVPPLSRPQSSKNLFLSSLLNSPPSTATRSTSVRVRTGISAPCGVPRGGYSISAWSRE